MIASTPSRVAWQVNALLKVRTQDAAWEGDTEMDSGILRNRSTLLAAASILALGSHAAPAFGAGAGRYRHRPAGLRSGWERHRRHRLRASLEDALEAKRRSNLIIESVTAEDIGKFPDQNVAESLQRLPGIQIDRENASSPSTDGGRTSRCSTAGSSSAGSKSTRSAKAITIATTASKACRPN